MNVLDALVARHGTPTFLRCDNGPEFAAFAIADWCRCNNASTTFIDPGVHSPRSSMRERITNRAAA